MKILITTDWYKPVINGVVTSVLNLQKELEHRGHDVKVLTLSQNHWPKREENVYYMGAFSLERVYPEARGTLGIWNSQVRELIDWKPDVVHSQCELMTFPMARQIAKKCSCPLVHTYHTVYEDYTHYFAGRFDKAGKIAVGLWTKYMMHRTHAVVVPTDKVKRLLERYGVEREICAIPSGIQLSKFHQEITMEEKLEIRRSMGIGDEKRVLVTIGRLAKEKNIHKMIQYVKRMKRSDVTLLIVGDGPYRGELEELVKQEGMEGRVVFTGMVKPEEVSKYYQVGEIFVSASQSETQGLTYIEALASGTPAVCLQDPCLEDVIYDGYNGYLFENCEEFQNRIKMLFSSEKLRLEMGKHAKEQAFSYSTEAFARKIESLYLAVQMKVGYSEVQEYMEVGGMYRAKD